MISILIWTIDIYKHGLVRNAVGTALLFFLLSFHAVNLED